MPVKTLKNVEEEQNLKGFIELDTERDIPIKKAMSAYVLFGNEKRQEIVRKFGNHLKVTEVVKIIAKEWRKLSKCEKMIYKERAKHDRLRFESELNQITTLSNENQVFDNSVEADVGLKPSHPEVPKKPLTPYMFFVRETRRKVVESMPHVRSLDIMKEVGNQWKHITNKELEHFRQMARDDLERYQREHKLFIESINQIRKASYNKLTQKASDQIEGATKIIT